MGFNVAYHFSDIVSFISRDQFIIFDPHGKNLPDEMLGLKVNYITEDLFKQYPNQMKPFELPSLVKGSESFGGIKPKEPFSGTLFRLPLRNNLQSSKSLLSKHSYTCSQMVQSLHEFAEIAPSMLIFLKHIEEISIYWISNANSSSFCKLISHTHIQNVTQQLRSDRNYISQYVSESKKGKTSLKDFVRSSFNFTIEHSFNSSTILQTWLIHSGSHSGIENMEEVIQKVQWAGVAALVSSQERQLSSSIIHPSIEGRAYCFLPLPIFTGLPIHINAFFALTSNRRDLWKEMDTEGLGTIKAKWNDHLLQQVLPKLYGEMLEIHTKYLTSEFEKTKDLRICNRIYNLFPEFERALSPFDNIIFAFIRDVVEQKRKIFWDSFACKWFSLDEILIEDVYSKLYIKEDLRQVLFRADIHLIDLPNNVTKILEKTKVPVPYIQPDILSEKLRLLRDIIIFKREQGEQLLQYILAEFDPSNSKKQQNNYFECLLGLKCIPLVGNQLGQAERKVNPSSNFGTNDEQKQFFVSSPEFHSIFETFPFFIDPNSPSYSKLNSPQCFQVLNICPLNLKSISKIMPYIIPETWHNRKCIAVKPLNALGGNLVDRRYVLNTQNEELIQTQNSKENNNPTEENEEKKSTNKGEWKVKPKKKKKNQPEKQTPKSHQNKEPKGPDVKEITTPTNLSNSTSSNLNISLESLSEKFSLLWLFFDKLVDFSEKDFNQFLGEWPIITTNQGFLVSLIYAKERMLLFSKDFSPEEERLLSVFGCLFTNILSSRLRQSLGISKQDTCKALSTSCKDLLTSVSLEHCKELQKLLLEWNEKKEVILYSKLVGNLPIFETLGGTYVSVWNAVLGTPSSNGDSFQVESEWDTLLEPHFPNQLLSYKKKEIRNLLKLVNVPRSPELEFLHRFLLKHLEKLPEPICLKFLTSIGVYKPWKTKSNASSNYSNFVDDIAKLAIIITFEGTRFKCRDFLDPEDSILSQILRKEEESTSANSNVRHSSSTEISTVYPPKNYRTSPILLAMRHCGMLNLYNPDGFLKAAQVVSQQKSVDSAILLVEQLLRSSEYLSWDIVFFEKLVKIPFFPVFDFRTLILPPKDCWTPPKYIDKNPKSNVKKKNIPNQKLSKKRPKQSETTILEAELEALDFDDEMQDPDLLRKGNDVDPIELYKLGGQLLFEGEKSISIEELQNKTFSEEEMEDKSSKKSRIKYAANSKPYMVLTKLHGIHVSLYANLWQSWTQIFILPKLFDNCQNDLLVKLNIPLSIPASIQCSHLESCINIWLNHLTKSFGSHRILELSHVKLLQAIVLFCCFGLHESLRGKPSLKSFIQKKLHSLPFVIMDDGQCIAASNIVMDLDEDLSTNLRMVPKYLNDLGYLLNLFGSPGIVSIPKPSIQASVPVYYDEVLLESIRNCLNKKELSDVEFRIPNQRPIYAHKLILGLTCSVFHSMFTSGMKEEDISTTHVVIQVEEEIPSDSVLLFLHYFYFGNLQRPGIRLTPYSQESVAIVIGLLRLSDKYFVDYIKQWCEVYLSDSQVITIQNVCNLFHISVMCNAAQLKSICIYEIQSIFHVIIETAEWKQLPSSIRDLALTLLKKN